MRNPFFIALLLIGSIAVYIGWKLFWFLTDDAYIAFRYISNSMLGYGYTWNAPPFRPVEGYTSFLWLVVLEGIWRITDIQPPVSANYISLLFAYATLGLTASMVLKMDLNKHLSTHRLWLLALVMFGIVPNRTFLIWASSGLETAMFNFFLVLWLYAALYARTRTRRFLLIVSSTTSLIYLTRPDGLLFACATLGLALLVILDTRGHLNPLKSFVALFPLALIPAHLIWRRFTYKAWLPNTYYAKYVTAWPESGLRYMCSFILEYALWIWLLVFALYLLRAFHPVRFIRHSLVDSQQFIGLLAVAAIVAHMAYYVFRIGGDHFEYRVFSHLPALLFVSFLWFLNKMKTGFKIVCLLLICFATFSHVLPWSHWYLSKDLKTREQTHTMHIALSDYFPSYVDWYVGRLDRMQAWLVAHYVCLRHQEHKVFHDHMEGLAPTRDEVLAKLGPQISELGPYPVLATGSGVLSWSLALINIIDASGLNDYVIARTPIAPNAYRKMAHDRVAPPGYIECYSPNVRVELVHGADGDQHSISIAPRAVALTADMIRTCENGNWY